MEQQNGPLPLTAEIELESIPDQWRLLESGVLSDLKISGTVKDNGVTKKIKIVLQKAFSPESFQSKVSLTGLKTNNPELAVEGSSRIFDYVHNKLEASSWLMVGYIEGQNQIPLMLIHYELINTTVYTQKLSSENSSQFLGPFSMN